MKTIEKRLAQYFLFPKKPWLDKIYKGGITDEKLIINALCKESFTEVIDQSKLVKFAFNEELKQAWLEKSLAVQVLEASNIGAPKRD